MLTCCFDGVSLLLLSRLSAKSFSYFLALWSEDRTVYVPIGSETGGRGRNPPGVVIAQTVHLILLGPMFFVEDR